MPHFVQPYAPVQWDLVPGRSAVVLIDLQNDLLHAEGWYAGQGIDISHMRRVIEPTKRLLEAAREMGLPVIWTRHGFQNETDAGTFTRLRPFLRDGGFREGSWGYGVYEEFEILPNERTVHKSRLSAFYNTNLELLLRGFHVETVIFTGILTNQCVAATSKDAMYRDMNAVVVEECTGTTMPELHEPVLKCIEVGWGSVRSLESTVREIAQLGVKTQ